MENIILIGMPACGKSTVGVILAKTMGKDFCDTDLVLQKMLGKTLQQEIDGEGLSAFLKQEEKAVLSVDVHNSVIATGGSVVFSDKAMKHLKKSGKAVYLSIPFEEIERRLINIKTRGVAKSKDESLYDVYKARVPLYEKYADIKIDCAGLSAEQTVEKILDECNC
jgi:shikimate kinase